MEQIEQGDFVEVAQQWALHFDDIVLIKNKGVLGPCLVMLGHIKENWEKKHTK